MGNRKLLLTGLDDRFERIRKIRQDVELQRSLTAQCPKAAGGIGHLGARQRPNDPAAIMLEQALRTGEMLQIAWVAVTDHHVGLPLEHRNNETFDIGGTVLVI